VSQSAGEERLYTANQSRIRPKNRKENMSGEKSVEETLFIIGGRPFNTNMKNKKYSKYCFVASVV
jgi:hypothetical protein